MVVIQSVSNAAKPPRSSTPPLLVASTVPVNSQFHYVFQRSDSPAPGVRPSLKFRIKYPNDDVAANAVNPISIPANTEVLKPKKDSDASVEEESPSKKRKNTYDDQQHNENQISISANTKDKLVKDSDAAVEEESPSKKKNTHDDQQHNENQNSISANTKDKSVLKPKKDSDAAVEEESSSKNTQDDQHHNENQTQNESSPPKPWNLRSRKGEIKKFDVNESGRDHNKAQEKNRKLTISLSKAEIENDILVMTGSKPKRKPRKRSKTVQGTLEALDRGQCLDSKSAKSIRDDDHLLISKVLKSEKSNKDCVRRRLAKLFQNSESDMVV